MRRSSAAAGPRSDFEYWRKTSRLGTIIHRVGEQKKTTHRPVFENKFTQSHETPHTSAETHVITPMDMQSSPHLLYRTANTSDSNKVSRQETLSLRLEQVRRGPQESSLPVRLQVHNSENVAVAGALPG
uniref:Uncharacterized protein n=1 Tax=Rhipicephalus zambeziensis TaxID=60191 RepID=A0A224Y708_9ACAR